MLIDRAWEVHPSPDPVVRDRIAEECAVSHLLANCLIHRGYLENDVIERFLNPRLRDLLKPDGMADLEKGASRLAEAIVSRERIGVFGDYDVDGLTSTALTYLFLRENRSAVDVRTADRFSSGYGLHRGVVDEFRDGGCTVIVVVDCGTSDHDAILYAGEFGIDVVVVDHHRVDSDYPKAYAFINPQRPDCGFNDKSLAAVGLAFYFCAAVKTELVFRGYLSPAAMDMRQYLDLVALGTVADVVPLCANNRILVSHGMRLLSEKRRPGVDALVQIARIQARVLTASHVSFQLAPRINAAGRLGSAMNAFELLVSTVESDAMEYASVLEQLTIERRDIESRVSRSARDLAEQQHIANTRILVVYGEGWHKGVLGIVAARLGDLYGIPVYVIGVHDGIGTGSARGGGQLNLYDSLEQCSDLLIRFGGHHDAAGFSVSADRIEAFHRRLMEFAESHWVSVHNELILCDATLTPEQLTREFVMEIQKLGPFGFSNPEPVFNIEGLAVQSVRVVGGSHLKMLFKTPRGLVSAFGPGMGEYSNIPDPIVKVAASLSLDEWRGDASIELRLLAPPAPCQKG